MQVSIDISSESTYGFFFNICDILVFFRFSLFVVNIAILFNLFRFYWKHFIISLSLFSYSWGQNKFVYSNKLLRFNIK